MRYARYALLLAVTVLAVTAFKCDDKAEKRMYDDLDRLGVQRPQFKDSFQRNWKGMQVISVASVPETALQAIERGYMRTVGRHSQQYPTWTKAKTLNELKVAFINPMATNQQTEPGSPALKVGGVQTCGTVIGVQYGDTRFTYMVLPHQAATNWQYLTYLESCAAHEGEHYIERFNDMNVFAAWNANDIHPRPFERCGTDPTIPC